MSKPLICKSQGKANGFESCGKSMTEFEKRTYGLCNSCLWSFYHEDERGKVIYQKSFLPKVSLKLKSIQKEKTKRMKDNVKTLSDWKSDLQKEINLIVRLIDNGHGCIATGSLEGKKNAGHYIGIGANETLRFHLENIWLQSEHSNMWKSGDTLRYQEGIVNLYGKDYLNHLNGLKSIQPIKLSIDEIKEKIKVCRTIVKWLKEQDRQFDKYERLSLRILFNTKIGIYK